MTTSTQNKQESDKFKDLVGPMDPKLDRLVREKMVTARVGMLLRASFFGNLATRLKLVNADEWCPTAATDGRNFITTADSWTCSSPRKWNSCLGTKCCTVSMTTSVVEATEIHSCSTLPMTIV